MKATRIRHFDLQTYQEDDLVLGTGQLSADQSGLAVNAAGSVPGNSPTIFISLIDSGQVFLLKFSVMLGKSVNPSATAGAWVGRPRRAVVHEP
jgi:hypothetical protein